MQTLAEFRQQYPDYDDVSDKDLADALHQKYGGDTSVGDFYRQIKFNYDPGLWEATKGAVHRGASGTAGLITEVAPALLYSMMGNDEAAQAKRAEFHERIQKLPPAIVKNYEELSLSDPRKAIIYGLEALGENLPSLLTSLTGAGLGVGIARAVGMRAAMGAATGAAGASAALNIPETFEEVASDTGELRPGVAITFGGAKAALDAIPAFMAVNALAKPVQDEILKRVLKQAGIQFLTEGPTEAAQAGIDELAKAYVNEHHEIFTPENVTKLIDTALKASISGAATGVGVGLLQKKTPPPPPPPPPLKYEDVDEATKARDYMKSVEGPERLALPPPEQYNTPLGVLSGPEVDQLLTNNKEIPEVAKILDATDLPVDVRRRRGIEAFTQLVEGTVGGEGKRPAQDPRTPLEALYDPRSPLDYPEGAEPGRPAMTGEEARERIQEKYDTLVDFTQNNFGGNELILQSQLINLGYKTAQNRTSVLERLARDGFAYRNKKGQYRVINEREETDKPFDVAKWRKDKEFGDTVYERMRAGEKPAAIAKDLKRPLDKVEEAGERGKEAWERSVAQREAAYSPRPPLRTPPTPTTPPSAPPSTPPTSEAPIEPRRTLTPEQEEQATSVLNYALETDDYSLGKNRITSQLSAFRRPNTNTPGGRELAAKKATVVPALEEALRRYEEHYSTKSTDDGIARMAPEGVSRRSFLGGLLAGAIWSVTPNSVKAQAALTDKNILEAVRNGDLGKTLSWLAKNSANPDFQNLAALLARNGVGNFKVTVLPNNLRTLNDMKRRKEITEEQYEATKSALAFVDLKNTEKPALFLMDTGNPNATGLSEEAILHEAIHAYIMSRYGTLRYYDNYNVQKFGLTAAKATKLIDDFGNLWDQLATATKKVITTKKLGNRIIEAMSNPNELLSYGLTNKEVQDYLKSLVWDSRGKRWVERSTEVKGAPSAWDRFVEWIANLFNIKSKPEIDALSRVLDLSNKVLEGAAADPTDFAFARAVKEHFARRGANLEKDTIAPLIRTTIVEDSPNFTTNESAPSTVNEAIRAVHEAQRAERAPPRLRDLGAIEGVVRHFSAIAYRHRQFRPFFDAIQHMHEIRSTIRASLLRDFAAAESHIPLRDRWRVEQFAEAAEYIPRAIERQSDGSFRLDVPEDAATFRSAPGETLILEGKFAEAYATRQRALIDGRKRLVSSFLQAFGYAPDTTVAQLRAMREDGNPVEKAVNLANLIESFNEHPNYNPHMRFGNMGITVKKKTYDENGNLRPEKEWEQVYYRTFEVMGRDGSPLRNFSRHLSDRTYLGMGQFRRADRMLREKFDSPEYVISKPYNVTYDKIKQIIGNPLADLRIAMDISSSHPEMMEEMLKEIRENMATRGMRAHFTRRKNIPGWLHEDNENVYGTRAISNYIMGLSNLVSRNETQQEFEKAYEALEGYPHMLTAAKAHESYVLNGSEEFQNLRNLAFFWFIALNLSSAAVNFTQTLHTTFPILTGLAGLKASPALGKAMKDALVILSNKKVLTNMVRGDVFAMLNIEKPTHFSDAKWAALLKAIRGGSVLPGQAFEQAGVTIGEHETLTGLRRNMNTIAQAGASFFGLAESFNRLSAFLAAYDLASQNESILTNSKTLDEVLGSEPTTPEQFALDVVRRTQFVSDKTNRPPLLQGKMIVPTQFMGFLIQMFELWWQMMQLRSGGAGKLVLAAMATTIIGTAGVWAVPGGDNIKWLIEKIYKFASDKDIDLDKELRKMFVEIGDAPDIVSRGLIPHLTGISLAGRAGAGQIFNPQMLSGNLENMTGPAGAMVIGSIKEAVDLWKNDKPYMATAALLPVAIRNVAKAFEAGEEGFRSKTGTQYVPPEKVTSADLIKQMSGFRPEDVGRIQARDIAINRLKGSLRDITEITNNRITDAYLDNIRATNDADRARANARINSILEEVQKHNEGKKPHEMIQVSRTSIRNQVRQALAAPTPSLRGVPKRMRGEALEMDRLYGGDR